MTAASSRATTPLAAATRGARATPCPTSPSGSWGVGSAGASSRGPTVGRTGGSTPAARRRSPETCCSCPPPPADDRRGALDPFGVDLYLDADGHLEITADGDLRTVRGVENLRQAIAGRMLTRRGESAAFPEYGLPVAPGDAHTAGMTGYIGAHVRTQLLADRRVLEVADLEVADEGDELTVTVQVRPNGSAPFTVIAPVG